MDAARTGSQKSCGILNAKGIGCRGAWVLAAEYFNAMSERRESAGFAGLGIDFTRFSILVSEADVARSECGHNAARMIVQGRLFMRATVDVYHLDLCIFEKPTCSASVRPWWDPRQVTRRRELKPRVYRGEGRNSERGQGLEAGRSLNA
jgi:hypothetical protein